MGVTKTKHDLILIEVSIIQHLSIFPWAQTNSTATWWGLGGCLGVLLNLYGDLLGLTGFPIKNRTEGIVEDTTPPFIVRATPRRWGRWRRWLLIGHTDIQSAGALTTKTLKIETSREQRLGGGRVDRAVFLPHSQSRHQLHRNAYGNSFKGGIPKKMRKDR